MKKIGELEIGSIKIVSWNVGNLYRLLGDSLNTTKQKRKNGIIQEIKDLGPDVLCMLEGPSGESGIDFVAKNWLADEWVPVKAADGKYSIRGRQWIWFLVRKDYKEKFSLLPVNTWDAFTASSWDYHRWGEYQERTHNHYRHPQVLILEWNGLRIEFIGLHLKSKYVNRGESNWKARGEKRKEFIREALTARIKMTTEATNVRAYIDAKFRQVENPAIIVMGDLNDGPGKEYFENNYLFFDLISNIQGDQFFARRFLDHALFYFSDELRWTCQFDDFVTEEKDKEILLDHILFTQGLGNRSLPFHVDLNTGKVEHEIHDLINASLTKSAKTSDHKPISVVLSSNE